MVTSRSCDPDSVSWSRDPDIDLDIDLGVILRFQPNFQQLPIPFILRSYRLFLSSMMSDLPADQPTVGVMAVAWGEKRLLSSTGLLKAQWYNEAW